MPRPKVHADRKAAYDARQRESGIVKIGVRVPIEDRQAILDIAAQLREQRRPPGGPRD